MSFEELERYAEDDRRERLHVPLGQIFVFLADLRRHSIPGQRIPRNEWLIDLSIHITTTQLMFVPRRGSDPPNAVRTSRTNERRCAYTTCGSSTTATCPARRLLPRRMPRPPCLRSRERRFSPPVVVHFPISEPPARPTEQGPVSSRRLEAARTGRRKKIQDML